MSGLIGALKGMLGGVGLLVVVALIPIVAVGAAHLASENLDVGFWPAFAVALALEGFLGLCALFGLSSEVERAHAEKLDETGRAGRGTPR